MESDPLMPAFRRFPRDADRGSDGEAMPSSARPFVLRGAQLGGVPSAKHRTPATQRKIQQTTTSDGKKPSTTTDTYTTPDD